MQVPADLYTQSPKRFDPTPIELDYPWLSQTESDACGRNQIDNVKVNVSLALKGWHVGLKLERMIATASGSVAFDWAISI